MCWSWACRSAIRWPTGWSTNWPPSAGLESGATPARVLETVAAIRRESQIPIVFYIYYNLIHRYGVGKFVNAAAKPGVDGLLALDLPPEESEKYEALMAQAAGLCAIYLIAPTTPESRMELIAKRGPAGSFITCRAKA
jgi:tryptophan synthase alpha chain